MIRKIIITIFASSLLCADESPRGYGVSVRGDFIYWKADSDGFDYCVEAELTNSSGAVGRGKYQEPHSEWGPGYRISLGYQFPWDRWDLLFTWTQFDVINMGHVITSKKNDNATVIPLWLPSNPTVGYFDNILFASSSWHLNLDVADLELGKEYFATKSLAIRPFMGLRYAWVDQEFEADYSGVGEKSSASLDGSAVFHGTNDYHALGPRAGLNMYWHLNRNWSLFGKAAASLLFGEFSLHNLATISDFENPTTLVNEREHNDRTRAVFEIGGGLMWEVFFSKGKRKFALSMAYELSQWLKQNQLRQFVFTDSMPSINWAQNGDLGLQGLTVSARLDF